MLRLAVPVFALAVAVHAMTWVSVPEARAEFLGKERSINGTGETLPASEWQLGAEELAYGVTDDWQVKAPSLATVAGYGRFEARRRFVQDNAPGGIDRISPYAYAESPSHIGVGTDVGWNFGQEHAHSLTAGARLRHGPLLRTDFAGGAVVKPRTYLLPNCEYDYYGRGNDAYVGMDSYILYSGYTWAFAHVHVGLIAFPASGVVPLPYIYWRF